MDLFIAPVFVTGRDGGLEVDDPDRRRDLIEHGQCLAPDGVETDRTQDLSALPFGKSDVVSCVHDRGLVQRRIAGIRQDLIDAATRHHVSAQKQRRVAGVLGRGAIIQKPAPIRVPPLDPQLRQRRKRLLFRPALQVPSEMRILGDL